MSADPTTSLWSSVPVNPPDPILGLNTAFKNDPAPNKIALGVGAYRDNDGLPWVLPSVREAEKRIFDRPDMEYTTISGIPAFVSLAQQLAFGQDHPSLPTIASSQTISGTGALRVAGAFLARFLPQDCNRTVYIPTPTWPNHKQVFGDCGMAVGSYRYYHKETKGLDLEGMVEDIRSAPPKSVILLHACAHNPTGVDPSLEQWSAISQVCKELNHVIVFDCAYQGFASGSPVTDSQAYRSFIDDGHQIILCQSFAKNMGLYGHRVGAIHVTCASPQEKDAVLSQVQLVIRAMYSNPPIYGAKVAAEVLGDAELRQQWQNELQTMAGRIHYMRNKLVEELKRVGSPHDWSHITRQIGMFCYTGLTPEQVTRLRDEQHIYLTMDGRVSIAGLNESNVTRVAECIHAVAP